MIDVRKAYLIPWPYVALTHTHTHINTTSKRRVKDDLALIYILDTISVSVLGNASVSVNLLMPLSVSRRR